MKSIVFGLFAAIAAVTVGKRPRHPAPPGDQKMTVTPITFPTKYVQNDSLTPADVGLNRVSHGYAVLTSLGEGNTVNIANVVYDYANGKIRLFDETPAQVAAEAEIKKPTALVYAFGS
jgi:hypothetical protein